MLDIGVLGITIGRAGVAPLNIAQAIDVDLIEEELGVRAPKKFHGPSLGWTRDFC